MVKKEAFEGLINKRKNIELRRRDSQERCWSSLSIWKEYSKKKDYEERVCKNGKGVRFLILSCLGQYWPPPPKDILRQSRKLRKVDTPYRW